MLVSPILFFEEHGDLRLTVGEGSSAQDMIVDSRVLCRSSTVLRKMLGTGGEESRPESGEWHVQLPADSPEHFAIVMGALHLLHEKTPTQLSLPQLWSIAIISNKYDMAKALWSWSPQWIQSLLKELYKNASMFLNSLNVVPTMQLVGIACEFKHTALFKEAMFILATVITVSPQGELESSEILALKANNDLHITSILRMYSSHRLVNHL